MPRIRQRSFVGLLALAGVGLFLASRSGRGVTTAERTDGPFVQAGPYYVNADRILYAEVKGDDLVVVLGPGLEGRLELTGGAAAQMRRWLDERATRVHLGPQNFAPPGQENYGPPRQGHLMPTPTGLQPRGPGDPGPARTESNGSPPHNSNDPPDSLAPTNPQGRPPSGLGASPFGKRRSR